MCWLYLEPQHVEVNFMTVMLYVLLFSKFVGGDELYFFSLQFVIQIRLFYSFCIIHRRCLHLRLVEFSRMYSMYVYLTEGQ